MTKGKDENDKWLDEIVANMQDKKLKLSSVNPEEYVEYIEEVKNTCDTSVFQVTQESEDKE